MFSWIGHGTHCSTIVGNLWLRPASYLNVACGFKSHCQVFSYVPYRTTGKHVTSSERQGGGECEKECRWEGYSPPSLCGTGTSSPHIQVLHLKLFSLSFGKCSILEWFIFILSVHILYLLCHLVNLELLKNAEGVSFTMPLNMTAVTGCSGGCRLSKLPCSAA